MNCVRRWFRLMGQRAVWRAAWVHFKSANRYLNDSDPEWRRIYRRCCIKATRDVRALRRWCESRRG